MAALAAIPIILLIAFVKSIGWVVEVLLPVLAAASVIALLLVPVLLLLAIPRITRGWAGLGITLSSYVVGVTLWTWSLVIAYAIAGVFWIVVGLLCAGVGVVAVAAIASAIQGEWFVFFEIAGTVIVVYLLRMLGAYLVEKANPRVDEHLPPPEPPDFSDDGNASYRQSLEPISEDEAVDIAVRFGEAFADCNEEGLFFKPMSRLPAPIDKVIEAMKLSYQRGYPLPDQLESSYRFCYPQLGFFVSDRAFDRARAYFDRLNNELVNDKHHPARLDYTNATVNLNSAPGIAHLQEPIQGDSITGSDLVEEMDAFFEHEFLIKAPDDADRERVIALARTCWREMRSLMADWEAFRGLVRTGDSGLEAKDVALIRIELNEKKRELTSYIDSLDDDET